jgi:nitrate reductase NapD
MNISGIVVKTAPEHLRNVLDNLKSSGLCDVFFHDETGKIIVTLEGRDTGEEVKKMKAILNMPHVLCANLAYSYCEEESGNTVDRSKSVGDAVPDVLKE